MDFANYVKDSGFKTLKLQGHGGMEQTCDILIRTEPRKSIKIGKGWKKFSAMNRFKKGDEVVFTFPFDNANIVNVTN